MTAQREAPEAGPALNVLVAERVIGEVVAHSPCGDGLTRTNEFYGATLAECDAAIREAFAKPVADGMRLWPAQYIGPDYSGDISAAMQVVERLIADGWRLYIDGPRFGDNTWRVMFARDRVAEWAEADTLPLAICRASLAALVSSSQHHEEGNRCSPRCAQ